VEPAAVEPTAAEQAVAAAAVAACCREVECGCRRVRSGGLGDPLGVTGWSEEF
jgi:hypothetical protein